MLAVMIAVCASPGVAAETDRPLVALAAFSYVDTSGEERDQAAQHQAWNAMFGHLLRDDLEKGGTLVLTETPCGGDDCAVVDGVAPEALIAAAKQAGAHYLIYGGIHKMSTLVQWARLEILDLATGKLVLDRLLTFRGDNEDAWRHAALYIAREVREARLPD